MTIITFDEARLIDPKVTESRLAALEVMIRDRTNNHFHTEHSVGVVRLSGDPGGDTTVSAVRLPALLPDDTVELLKVGPASGLYSVVSVSGNEAVLRGRPFRAGFAWADGSVCLVEYPADIKEGVRALLEYDAERAQAKAATPTDLKSQTVGRVSETYRDDEMVRTPAGVYPAALLGFLDGHRRLSWGL